MPETPAISGPAFTPERFADRLAEAIRVANNPEAFAQLPGWTQKVMLILRDQLIPQEFTTMFTAEHALLAEGLCVAWMAHARDAMSDANDSAFARRVAEWLTRAPQTAHVADQVAHAEIAQSPEFREHIMRRLFAENAAERRAFAEGLALGNRVYDLFADHVGQRSTDATRVYILLWLYWPEIARLGSVGEAAGLVERLLTANRSVTGRSWDERFRKIANRIGLSYRAKQARTQTTPSRARRKP